MSLGLLKSETPLDYPAGLIFVLEHADDAVGGFRSHYDGSEGLRKVFDQA